MLPGLGQVQLEELAQQSADEAMVVLLSRLHTFQGRSRFTTWAYKLAILQAATEVRRQAWRSREVVLHLATSGVDLPASTRGRAR